MDIQAPPQPCRLDPLSSGNHVSNGPWGELGRNGLEQIQVPAWRLSERNMHDKE